MAVQSYTPGVLPIIRDANKRELADLRPPNIPFAVPSEAAVVKSIYLGIATAARMPIMTMITINSINVNPF
jgi:hypothetical protein